MPNIKSSTLSFAELRASGLVRPAAEKFAGAWLACFLVMTRSDALQALSFEHVLRASVCGLWAPLLRLLSFHRWIARLTRLLGR